MNENINLVEILKDCPKGTKLYSLIHGHVEFSQILNEGNLVIEVLATTNSGKRSNEYYTFKGQKNSVYNDAECVLFPSKEQRDWSKFTAPWYKKEKSSLQTNERTWLYLVSDVLTWKDGIGQYLDNPEVQEIAKRLCDKYAQKLYTPSVLSNSLNTKKNEQKVY